MTEGLGPESSGGPEATPDGVSETEDRWLSPREIVAELDGYVVGQAEAKRAVAIALRNRWRRQRVSDDLRDEIVPSNIILIGPTGVGKTEIARRLSRLAGAPFVKVEASKFTEVGYVGRDVESMIRDLVDMAVNMVRAEREDDVAEAGEARAEERLLDLLLPGSAGPGSEGPGQDAPQVEHPVWVAGPSGVQPTAEGDGSGTGSSRTGRSRSKSARLPPLRG